MVQTGTSIYRQVQTDRDRYMQYIQVQIGMYGTDRYKHIQAGTDR